MSITQISRDTLTQVVDIIRVVSTDTLATVGTAGYLTAQASNISIINNGPFNFTAQDTFLVCASNGWGFFSISSDFTSLNTFNISQTVVTSITAAQFNGMYAAPILLQAAPGSGLLYIVNSAYLEQVYGTTQSANGGATQIQYESTVHGAGTAASTSVAAATLNAATANTVYTFGTALVIPTAAAVNQPLYLSNASGAFTASDSVYELTTHYSILPV